MDIAANDASVPAVRPAWTPARREPLWPSLTAAWMRHLDRQVHGRQVHGDVSRLDHPAVLTDFQEALHD
jgi:hypothetical protein